MVFSSAIFLFCFLPAVFLLDRLLRGVRLKNLLLLVASLIFYSFGQPVYLPLLLISVLLNYLCGLLAAGKHAKLGVALAVAGGIGMMAVFKYADFALGTVNSLFGTSLPLPGITLPFDYTVLICPVVIVWYILTELGSIIENAVALGAPCPAWLAGVVDAAKDAVEEGGSKILPQSGEDEDT